MTGTRPAEILRHLEQTETDTGLLARFVAAKDGAAFAELVRRHGALVLGVCRRVTGHPQDAEDAFQATFLVLAQKAALLRDAALLGNWLYGVAFRVASRAKRSARRRRAREVTVAVLPESPATPTATQITELLPVLDEELARLSACYREAIVLCDLRNTPRAEAAVALGIPEGTLSSRLSTGRKKLAARLTRRGVTLSTAALPMAITEVQAAMGVPNELVTKTCGLVAGWATNGAVPGPLARLTEGGFAVRKSLMLGAMLAVAVTGVVLAARPLDAPPTALPEPLLADKPGPAPRPKDEPNATDKPAATRATTLRMVKAFDTKLTSYRFGLVAMWNATGTNLTLLGEEITAKQEFVEPGKHPVFVTARAVRMFATDGTELALPTYLGTNTSLAAVQPDGAGFVTSLREYQFISGNHQLDFWSTKPPNRRADFIKSVPLELPVTHGYAFADDMKTYRTVAAESSPSGGGAKLEVLEVDANTGRAKKSLLKLDHAKFALSANGKRLALLDKEATKVVIYDTDRGTKVSELALPGGKLSERPRIVQHEGQEPITQDEPAMALSPNGKRLIISRAIGQTFLFDTEKGETMPPLEGIGGHRVYLDAQGFSGDGRLLAVSGTAHKSVKLGSIRNGQIGLGGLGRAKEADEENVWLTGAEFLTVWDTQTGRALKTWDRSRQVAFNPAQPLLAIMEPNGDDKTRIGFWDFSAEIEKK